MKSFFIIFILCFFIYDSNALSANENVSKLSHDGKIRFYAYHLNEVIDLEYLDENKKWRPEAGEKIQSLCRSRGDKKEIQIDPRLVILADHLQDHFQVDAIEVISCFRSSAFNKSLKEAGRNVANKSFHIKGMAMDIHIDEIEMTKVRDYLLSLKLGGVGYYGDKLMVHMDFGPFRQWSGGSFKENTEIGLFNKKSPVKIRTDKLNYFSGDKIKLSNSHDLKTDLMVQHFSRGKWKSVKTTILKSELDANWVSGFGKYRLRYEFGSDWQNSNEFYIKK